MNLFRPIHNFKTSVGNQFFFHPKVNCFVTLPYITKDITSNVLANPILSSYLLPKKTVPIKSNGNVINSIQNIQCYHSHPFATIQLSHYIYKQTGFKFLLL